MGCWIKKVDIQKLGVERGVRISPGDPCHRVSEAYVVSVRLEGITMDKEY